MFQGAAHLTSHSSMKVSNKTDEHMYMYTLFYFIIVTSKTLHTYINLKLCLQTINIPCLVYDMYLSLFVSCHVRSSHYIRFRSQTIFSNEVNIRITNTNTYSVWQYTYKAKTHDVNSSH